jgi:hypothetical protein
MNKEVYRYHPELFIVQRLSFLSVSVSLYIKSTKTAQIATSWAIYKYNFISSAIHYLEKNIIVLHFVVFMSVSYIKNKKGPNIDPCVTPHSFG